MSEIAAGLGFTTKVVLSLALSDALEPITTEIDSDYDQRLYDGLWLVHFQLGRDQVSEAAFNFTFARKHGLAEEITDASLRLRVETHNEILFVGLLEDF